jgi:hypothetical protein
MIVRKRSTWLIRGAKNEVLDIALRPVYLSRAPNDLSNHWNSNAMNHQTTNSTTDLRNLVARFTGGGLRALTGRILVGGLRRARSESWVRRKLSA